MRMAAISAALAIAFALGGSAARGGAGACQDALDQYNTVLSDVRDALHDYGRCVSDSHGHDDCATEFSTLQSTQDDFESAVSNYQGDCS